jgi:hypothetical protein
MELGILHPNRNSVTANPEILTWAKPRRSSHSACKLVQQSGMLDIL